MRLWKDLSLVTARIAEQNKDYTKCKAHLRMLKGY